MNLRTVTMPAAALALAVVFLSCEETNILVRVYTVEGGVRTQQLSGGSSAHVPLALPVGDVTITCYAFANRINPRPQSFTTDSLGAGQMLIPVSSDSSAKSGRLVASREGFNTEDFFFTYHALDTVTIIMHLTRKRG